MKPAEKRRVDKEEFVEFLKLSAAMLSLAFSTNQKGQIFPSGKGRKKSEDKVFVEGRSTLLDRVAKFYTGSVRENGGKFTIDFHGAYCYGAKRYFIEWHQSSDWHEYENSIPDGPYYATLIEMLAGIKKKEATK